MPEDPNQLPRALARDLLRRGYVALPAHTFRTIQAAATSGGHADAAVITAALRAIDEIEGSDYDRWVTQQAFRSLRAVLNDWQRKAGRRHSFRN